MVINGNKKPRGEQVAEGKCVPPDPHKERVKRLKRKTSKRKKTKKRLQISQKIALIIVVFSMGIVALTIVLNFLLVWFQRGAMTDETIATISTYGGITAVAGTTVYGALHLLREASLNKHGLRVPPDGSGKYYLENPNINHREEFEDAS